MENQSCDAIVTEEGRLIIKSADKMQIFELKSQNGIEGSEKDSWVKLNAEFPQKGVFVKKCLCSWI